tara:strand:- start:1250 stop:2149 length:900 start_codon:yes stop_codon:yes gene_type:complete
MKVTNHHGLPPIVVKALTQDDYTKGKSNRSMTQLIDSPRVGVLFKEHEAEVEKDVTDFLWSRFGTAMHNVFENAVEGTESLITEERLYTESLGWTISGAIDLQEITPNGRIISDYKVTSAWSVIFGKKEWHNQLNAYAWLVRKATGDSVKQLRIICIIRDWQRRRSYEDPSYPQSPIEVIPIGLWSDRDQDQYMEGRIKLHQNAEFDRLTGSELPHCSDAERWKKEDTFAVIKKGRKRAVRVLDSMKDAELFLNNLEDAKQHSIDTRKGEATRCVQDWCSVARWCDQYQKASDVMENNQ